MDNKNIKKNSNCSERQDLTEYNNKLEALKTAIRESENILIFSHVNPDGDTLGSALASCLIIEKYFNKKATPVYMGTFPKIYNFLPEADKFKSVDEIDLKKKYDLIIAVDIASKERLSKALPAFKNAGCTINIDHHKTNIEFGNINFVNPKASSSGEVLFDICESLDLKLDKDIAICLYTAVLTDTGGFKYENTTSKTLMTASILVSYGANPTDIYTACYESKPQTMVQLQAYVTNNAIFLENGKIAYTIIHQDIMKKFNASDDSTDGIAEALRQVNTVEIAMVLKETTDNYTKISLRSKNVDVSKIAFNFNGGGHEFAAGCTIKKPPKVALNKILEYAKESLK